MSEPEEKLDLSLLLVNSLKDLVEANRVIAEQLITFNNHIENFNKNVANLVALGRNTQNINAIKDMATTFFNFKRG